MEKSDSYIPYIVDFTGGQTLRPVTSLFASPVRLLIREVMAERHTDSLALFRPERGQDIIARLAEWRRPVIDHVGGGGSPLRDYPARASLREILTGLRPL